MPHDIDDRVLSFACRAVDLFERLDGRGGAPREVARQYLRAATSVGANCAEASAGQTKPDFLSKLAVARKECREAIFWLRLMEQRAMLGHDIVQAELSQARQLAAILTAIIRNARRSPSRGHDGD